MLSFVKLMNLLIQMNLNHNKKIMQVGMEIMAVDTIGKPNEWSQMEFPCWT